MNRFVAMLWDVRYAERTHQVCAWTEALQKTSGSWRVVLNAPGLRVLVLEQIANQLAITEMNGADGVVIGHLFERGREKAGRLICLDAHRTSAIVASGGGHLINAYWGSYVALWRERHSTTAHVLRGPCGSVPCFRTHTADVEIICSFILDIADLPFPSFSIDWGYLQAFLLNNYLSTTRTGLKEVSELWPGERMTWSPDSEPQSARIWCASGLAAKPTRQSFEEARAELRHVAEECFAAWGQTYKNVLVRLSGGLDSSVVVNLLRRVSDARIVGLHFLGPGYEAHEVALARLASQHAEINLLEQQLDPMAADLRSIADQARLSRPTKQILGGPADQLVVEISTQQNSDVVMAGHGGDSLFLQRALAMHMLADYVRLHGLGRELWQVAYETALLMQLPVSSVVRDAFHLRRKTQPAGVSKSLPNSIWRFPEDATNNASNIDNSSPSNAKNVRLPPCKALQVQSILALPYYNVVVQSGVRLDALNPFVSQPIIEFALRTPAYLFARGGYDRSLERSAFGDLIPKAVVHRHEKGFINHYLISMLSRNSRFLREFVLDGALVRRGWIEQESVERLLAPERLVRGHDLEPVCNLVAAEAWLHSWRPTHAP